MTKRDRPKCLHFEHCEPAPEVGSRVTVSGFSRDIDGAYIVDGVVGHWDRQVDVYLRMVTDDE